MKFSSAITTLSLLGLTSAAPPWFNWPGFARSKCMTKAVGEEIVHQFGSLLSNFDAGTAANLLNQDDFVDTSDSINFLANLPQGQPTFPSAGAFIGGQGSQPAISFTLLAVDSVSCEGVITFRWSAGVGMNKIPVQGINVLYTTLPADDGDVTVVGAGGWQISRVFSEFNSAAWVVDVGGGCALPTPSSSAAPEGTSASMSRGRRLKRGIS